MADTPSPPLVCAVCLYDGQEAVANPAVTVIEGYAVCYEHLGIVAQGEDFASIVRTARSQPIQRPADEETPDRG